MSVSNKDVRRAQRYWKQRGRKDFFKWLYRYLRLHKELLSDGDYQHMYEYIQKTLIAYMRRDMNCTNAEDELLIMFIDKHADVFNESEPERVEKFQWVVEYLHDHHMGSSLDKYGINV